MESDSLGPAPSIKSESAPTIPKDESPQSVSDIKQQQQIEEAFVLGRVPQRKKAGRNVRFNIESEESNFIVYIEPRLVLTDEDSEKCWWSRQETIAMYRDAKRVAKEFREKESASLNRFNELFQRCNSLMSISDLMEHDSAHILSLQQADCRGLERLVYPIIPGYRTKHVKTLLDIQGKLTTDVTPEARERLLSAKSAHISKPSRTLAKLLAHCDAGEVVYLIRQELRDDFPSQTEPL